VKRAGQAALQTSGASADNGVTVRSPAAIGAAMALVAMIVLCVAWERWLAPLRPGGSALVFKALPLVFALPGVLRRRLYTLQWASMLILLYFAEGIVRGMTDAQASARLGWIETALALVFLMCALAYLAPFKRAAKKARRGPHSAAAAQASAARRRTPS
jgi:uncharacterized membrane protein